MTISASKIFIYAADNTDYGNALQIANAFGLPFGNVIGSYANAFTAAASGNFMLIAIGGAANNAMYYNPCGWSGHPTGYTPFRRYDTLISNLPPKDYYMNAAGSTATESYNYAYAYVDCAKNGNCSASINPLAPNSSECVGSNPANQNPASFGTTCNGSDTCGGSIGHSCVSLSDIESTAVDSGWDPEAIAQTVLNLMNGSGVNTYGMDRYMAVAAMEIQGCYECPSTCYQFGDSCDCSSPVVGEGYGVLQDTWSSAGRLDHSNSALTSLSNNNQSEAVWFPWGITPCTVVSDPGAAFSVFYWWALTRSENNCGTIPYWVVSPCNAACCAIREYTAQTGISCTYDNSAINCLCSS